MGNTPNNKPLGEVREETMPDFDLYVKSLNHIFESGHNDIRLRECLERFSINYVLPLQEDVTFWKDSFKEKSKELAKCVKINGECLEEIRTLRSQLEHYADKNQNQ